MTIRVGILTVSDRSARGERSDLSGPALEELIVTQGWQVVRRAVSPDDSDAISSILATWSDQQGVDLILTSGGTGFAPRDVTPEATLAIIDRQTPGLAEAMRAASLAVTPHGMLSRAIAGIRARTIIVNLPGNPRGAVENLQVIMPVLLHAVQLLREDPDADKGHQTIPVT